MSLGHSYRSARHRPAADLAPGAVPRLGVELRPRTGGLDAPARFRGCAGWLPRPDRDRDHRHARVSGIEYASLFRSPWRPPPCCTYAGYRRRVRIALRALSPMLGAISVAAMIVLTWDVVVFGGWNLAPLIGGSGPDGRFCSPGHASPSRSPAARRASTALRQADADRRRGVVDTTIAQRLCAQPEYGLHPVGFLDDDPPSRNGNGHATATATATALLPAPGTSVPVLGSPSDLTELGGDPRRGARHLRLHLRARSASAGAGRALGAARTRRSRWCRACSSR